MQEGKGAMQARRRELFAVQAARAEMRVFALLPEANRQGTTQAASVVPHSDTMDEMKNRLERMESLLLARRRSSRDDSRASSSLVEGKEDDASYHLMDRIGFSSFIGTTMLLLVSTAGIKIHSVR
ncbi:3-(3-hydroxy-phenyl)propionate/3-hydroxycinnamic acid hydroxylase [Aspergillus udagawae]|uniref:3-(3-hydroxy-phenyl)propionate/3-hydroxycinnamic acid hydroxylase n=1 Tax=Aspergillus udagawae TaxID=91492 RepID=A0A8H3P7F4_9EURO|nr:3-(3-hydroxy-phenyl)propionate/3-hydroxycinnamic acid hydroxylase [Aspergillus udagawae]